MNDCLKGAVETLRNPDTSMKPVQLGDQREAALVAGLHGLAEEFGKQISHTYIDSNGEMAFNIIGPEGNTPGASCGQYGEELAAWLSTVPRRTGARPTTSPILPENGWCRINHFDVERLLLAVAEDLEMKQDAGAGPSGP